ncbi:hypothetical protein IFM89_023076 [Coptis chinensis]|uniref:DUF4378 domain-containing protein n=1 Tax=Coptis chinensis TaxID=261450 RepID=A0A835M1F4_9MAGN|nr:hypothetical protein IFM89_023076 [Coptis chinensis]
MPQESLRSVVYRSLVTCDDPNGVVEYETMRKSKKGSRKEHKIERCGTSNDSSRYSAHKEKELFSNVITEELHIPSPFQILEVSKGAQKLNLMIDTWSKGLSFDEQSKDIARDLLKGALDLQESLVMLSKLQEASNYMSQMKKKHELKYGGIDDIGVERKYADRFAEKNKHNEMQRGHLSLDGSSRKSVEELKNVIRESLSRQNLLSFPSEEENSSFGTRKMCNVSDIPSTSSRQSSNIHSNNSASMDWSICTSKEMKAKPSNVIAKLMGLEDFPSSSSHLKKPKSKNSLDHRRWIFDAGMPNVRQAYFLRPKDDPDRKTLKEVIESMHFKGLLKGTDIKGLKLQTDNSCESRSSSKHKLDDDIPPIVLIKPLHTPCIEKEGSFLRNSSREESYLYSNVKQELRDTLSKRLNQGGQQMEPEEMHNRLEKKKEPPSITLHDNVKAWNAEEILIEVQEKETQSERSIQEKRFQNSRETRREQEVREPKTRVKATSKLKQGKIPINHKSEEKAATDKKVDKAQKVLPSSKVKVEKQNVKSVTMLRSQDQVRATSTKLRKTDNGPIIVKNPQRQCTTQNSGPAPLIQSTSQASIDQANNNVTRNGKSIPNKLLELDDREINQTSTIEAVSNMTTSAGIEDQLPAREDTELSIILIEDHDGENLSSLCEESTENSQYDGSINSAEELKRLLDHKIQMEEADKNEITLKGLLLSCPSFLSCAEDYFELHMNRNATTYQTILVEDVDIINTKLLLDCANELMECKSRRISIGSHRVPWTHMVAPRINISLMQLLKEVCDGIAKLKHYTKAKLVDDTAPLDGVCKLIERDIKWKEKMMCGTWDLDWEHRFSLNEATQLVGELEKQVLDQLIEEIIVDFLNTLVQLQHFQTC